MKRALEHTRPKLGWAGGLALSLVALANPTINAQTNEATITQIVNDVRLHVGTSAPRSGVLNDKVSDGSSVQTGKDSRTELTFADRRVARLSANTVATFKNRTRDLELVDGAMLVQAPRRGAAAKITIAGMVAVVRGTAIVEYHPHAYLKFISLEDTGRLFVKHRWGESVLIPPGQMLITNPDATRLADPVDVDLGRLLRTSLLLVNFPRLASQDLIAKEIAEQEKAKSKKRLVDTNLIIFGKGTVVSLANPALMNTDSQTTVSSVPDRSDTIPSSNDLGTVETPPRQAASQSGATNKAPDIQH
jgi:hypothetical protein